MIEIKLKEAKELLEQYYAYILLWYIWLKKLTGKDFNWKVLSGF